MDEKTIQLICALKQLSNHNEPVDQSTLANYLCVSTRTVRTYVTQANHALEDIATIELMRGEGYILRVKDNETLERELTHNLRSRALMPTTPEDRVNYLLYDLLQRTSWITLDELAQMLYVSRATLSNDLREVEAILSTYDLELARRPHHGIKVEGPEFARRICLASSSLREDAAVSGLLEDSGVTLDAVAKQVDAVLKEHDFSINSMTYQNLMIHIAVAVMRIKHQNYVPIDSERLAHIEKHVEYGVAKDVANAIEKAFDVTLPESEVAYIAIHLASKYSLSDIVETTLVDDKGAQPNLIISDEVWDVVSKMIHLVSETYHYDLNHDLELRMNLARHIVPLSVRLQYNMKLDNPMLLEIKTRFTLAYSMAIDASSVLKDAYGNYPSEEEIGYIALSFALALERMKDPAPKKTILVVCASGHGSAKLLEYRYREKFGKYLDDVIVCDISNVANQDFTRIDYVLTTVPLPQGLVVPVPVRSVNYFLNQGDEANIKALLTEEVEENNYMLRYFSPTLFFTHLHGENKEQIIHQLCELTNKERYLPEDFENLVLERESLAITSFGNSVAMPHPMKPITEDTFVVVGLLDEPISWNNHQVRAVFLVSIANQKHKQLDSFYRTMARLLSSKEAIQELLKQQDFECLKQLLEKYVVKK